MAKTTAPLLSFGGSGQIGKTQVYASWRGVSYARRYVVPANPNSESQQATRGVFSWLNGSWKLLNPAVQEVWFLFAKGKKFTDRNGYISRNLSNLRGTDDVPNTTLQPFIASPGVNAGFAATSLAASALTGGGATLTLGLPTLPDGWAAVAAHGVAFKDANPNTSKVYTSKYAIEAGATGAIVFTAIGDGTWDFSCFWEYTKPDGSTAYSPSLQHQAVVTG